MKDSRTYNHYHAAVINIRLVKDIPLAEAIYAPNLELPKHSHGHAGFCLILQGKYVESYGKTVLELSPSSVKFQPAEEVHSDAYGNDPVKCFIVELEPEWLNRIGACLLVGNSPTVFRSNSITWLMMRLRREFHSLDDESPLAVEGLVLELLAETSRTRKAIAEEPRSRWLRQVKEFLDESFSEPLTLSVIAETVKVHPVYLANSFRRHYHCSIGEYLRRRRVEFASHRISMARDPLVSIALAAGFSNQSHFTRTFKQVTGMTPGQYRASCRLS